MTPVQILLKYFVVRTISAVLPFRRKYHSVKQHAHDELITLKYETMYFRQLLTVCIFLQLVPILQIPPTFQNMLVGGLAVIPYPSVCAWCNGIPSRVRLG